jgi:hypothetical protein
MIVASILLAFGIQTWWETQTEADREQRLLTALSAEFEQNAELLTRAGSAYRARYLAASRILDAIDGGSLEVDDVELRAWVQGLVSAQTFHLESGAHDALLASGELNVISDEALRARLAAWPSYVEEWAEEERAVFSFAQETLVPYLSQQAALREIQPPFRPFPDGQSPPQLRAPSGNGPSLGPLLREIEFENLVYRGAQGLWYAIRDGETLREHLAAVLESIQTNRGR